MFQFAPQLKKCAILQGLSDEELQVLLNCVTFEDFREGEEILTEGRHYQSLWVLLQGTCAVSKHGTRHDNELAQLGPGSVFGEMSFYDTSPHSASVIATVPCHTMRLMRADYEGLRLMAPDTAYKVALNVVKILSDRLRRMDHWTCQLVERDSNPQQHHEWQDFRAKLYNGLDI